MDPVAPPEPFSVLVVDDEPEILDLLRYNFSRKGLEVTTARNGEHALEGIRQHKPRVIVLDIMMPVMNGIELCRILRADPEYKTVPILFLSATSDDMLILSAMSSGGDHFVSKPVHLNLLFRIVNEMHSGQVQGPAGSDLSRPGESPRNNAFMRG